MNNTDNKKLNKYLYLITLLPIAVLLTFNLFQYCENDDMFIYNIAYGKYEASAINYATHIHPLLGGIWKFLYSSFNNINWIVLTYLLLVIICTCILMNLLTNYLKIGYVIALSLVFETIFCCWFTYTVIGSFATFFGIVTLLKALKDSNIKNKPFLFILSIFLVEIGFLLRFSMFISTVLITVPFVVYYLRKINRVNKKLILFLGISIILLCIVNIWSDYSLNNSRRNAEYRKWDDMRVKAVDYPIMEYDNYKDFYESISYSENDYEGLAFTKYIADKDVYSYNNLKKIVDNTPFNIRYNVNLLSVILIIIKLKEVWIFICFWLICFFAVSKKKLYVVVQGLLALGSIVGQVVINRYVHRVFVPLLIVSSIILTIVTLENIKKNYEKFFYIGTLIICSIYCVISVKQLSMHNNHTVKAQEKYKQFCNYINQHKENLYITNGNGPIIDKESVQLFNNKEKYLNLMSLYNYDLYNDTYYRKVKEYKLTHKDRLIMDITDNNVFYVDLDNNGLKNIKKYIEEHSKRRLIIKKEKEMKKAKCTIYKIRYRE